MPYHVTTCVLGCAAAMPLDEDYIVPTQPLGQRPTWSSGSLPSSFGVFYVA